MVLLQCITLVVVEVLVLLLTRLLLVHEEAQVVKVAVEQVQLITGQVHQLVFVLLQVKPTKAVAVVEELLVQVVVEKLVVKES